MTLLILKLIGPINLTLLHLEFETASSLNLLPAFNPVPPAARKKFFEKLLSRIGGNNEYWIDTEEALSPKFQSLVFHQGLLDKATSDSDRSLLQNKLCNLSLGIVYFDDCQAAAEKIKDIVEPHFQFVGTNVQLNYKKNLQNIYLSLINYNFICHGGGKVFKGKTYSHAAIAIMDHLQKALHKGEVIAVDYGMIMQQIHNELINKRTTTWGFFGWGKRDDSTVDFYKVLYSNADNYLKKMMSLR